MNLKQEKDKESLPPQTEGRSFIYQDIYEVCASLGITVEDFQRYYAYRVVSLDLDTPVTLKPLDFLIRVLKNYPFLCPIPSRKSFEEMEAVFKQSIEGYEAPLPPYALHQFLGIPKSTYYNMKNCKTPPTKAMDVAFNTILPLLKKGSEGIGALLKLEKEFDLSRTLEAQNKPKILTYQDVYDLCDSLKISVYEFQKYYGFTIASRKKEDPINKKSLDFMVRVLRTYPHLCSFPKMWSFSEMEKVFKKHVDLLDYFKPNSYYAFLGFTYSTYASRKAAGLEPSKSMNAIFNTVLPLLIERDTEGALSLLKLERESEKYRRRKKSL